MLTALSTLAALAFCALFASLNARGRARAERRAAAALGDAQAERSRLAAVLEGARAVVLTFGRDGKLVACNAEAQELLAALGRTARIFDLSADESWHAAARGALDGRPARFDQTFVVGGEARHFDFSFTPGAGAVVAVGRDITERRAADARVSALTRQLMDASRQAGMAEVATGVLHNVGNVLNSVNVAAGVAADRARAMKLAGVARAAEALRGRGDDGKLAEYLERLAAVLVEQRDEVLDELAALTRNIDHIKVIVSTQQTLAGTTRGLREELSAVELVEDALRLNEGSFQRHRVEIVRRFDETPRFIAERHRILEILVNLIGNARQAMVDAPEEQPRRLTVAVAALGDRIRFAVEDTGVGIAAENLTRIFGHGFSTRKDGHGFGLHASANGAREMGGSLTAFSDGPGQGATFALEVPFRPTADPALAAAAPL